VWSSSDCSALTKEEADSLLKYEVIGVDTVTHELIAFGFDTFLATGATIFPYWPEPLPAHVDSGFYCESPHVNAEPTWFYWIDDYPYAHFVHETRYVYILDSDGSITVDTGYWWPVIDSLEYWHDDSEYWDQDYWVWSNVSYIPSMEFNMMPFESLYLPTAMQEVCCLVLQGDPAQSFTDNSSNMGAAFDSLGFQATTLKHSAASRDSVLKKLEEMCANDDCPCLWIYASSHGSVDAADNHYFTWGGSRITSAQIKAKLDNCGTKNVCLTMQGCKSGEIVNDLSGHPRIRLITTATDSTHKSYSADPQRSWEANPWDKGSEYTSGFAEDLGILEESKTSMRVARKVAEDSSTCLCEVLGSEAHNTAIGKDQWFNDGTNANRFKEFPQQHSDTGFPVDTCEVGIGVGQTACVVFGTNMLERKVCWKCDKDSRPRWSWTRGCADCEPCGTNCGCTAYPAGKKVRIGGTEVAENTVVSNIPVTSAGVADHWSVIVDGDTTGCICLKMEAQPDTITFSIHNGNDFSASVITVYFSGGEGALQGCNVVANPEGCPEPTTVAADQTVVIDWNSCCFPYCQTVEFEVISDYPCPSLAIDRVEWTFTAVELADFTAAGRGNLVEVTWRTATELDNAGFNIHRALSADGPFNRINEALIPAEGEEIRGASYTFEDRNVINGVKYFYRLEDVSLSGAGTMYGPIAVTAGSEPGDGPELPAVFSLNQNYPNPFNATTEIRYDLPRDCNVELTIYNVAGQRVRILVNKRETAGYKNARWDGTNDEGTAVTSGVYFYVLKTDGFKEIKKMVLLR
jgi:hypothetical protein